VLSGHLDFEYEISTAICKQFVKLESQIARIKTNTLYYRILK